MVHSSNDTEYGTSKWIGYQTSGLHHCICSSRDEVYIEPSKLCGPISGKYVILLLLLRSMYGLKQAPRAFFLSSDMDYWKEGSLNKKLIHVCI
jgi:hypothetical protein